MSPKIFIVIPVHNRAAFTRACLECLREQTFRDFRVIVVDDGSTDGTSEMIRNEFPDTILLHGDGNLWWTGATNLGIRTALNSGAEYLLTLNDDTLPGKEFLENMWAAALREPRSLIGAYAVDAGSGRAVFGGSRVNWIAASALDLLLDPTNPRTGLVEVTHYPGRGLLIPAELLQRIGTFDATHFPHYLADYDFTLRARRYGYKIFCNYSAVLAIFPEASGDAENRKRKGLRNYIRHLFHIKGGGNLKAFFWLALKNCPGVLLPICLFVGIARRVFGYPLDWTKETVAEWRNRDASYRRA